jgi:hypothetical protein
MRIYQSMYWLSAALTLAGLVTHEGLGAPAMLPPLLTSGMPEEVIWMHHFSWHVDSVAVAAMIFLFIHAARKPGNIAIAMVAIGMSASFSAIGIALAVLESAAMWGTPAPYAWSSIAVVGSIGAWLEWRSGQEA